MNNLQFICRPHPYYGDVISEQACNYCFIRKIQTAEYNTMATITDAIRQTSRESLKDRRCLQRMCYSYKVTNPKPLSC